MPRDPLVSYIVCTRDRPASLIAGVRSIARAIRVSGLGAVEILVIENGSAPRLRIDPAALAEAAPGHVRLISVAGGNLAQARNLGMAKSAGQLLAYTDDDCILDPDHLRDALRHWEAEPAPFLIGGRVRLDDPTDLPFTIKDDPRPCDFHEDHHPGGFVQGCNFIVTRETAARIGPFDTRFGAGARFRSGEDTDYTIRAHAAGVRVRYVPDMALRHRHGRKTREAVDRLNRDYAFGNGAILAKHALRQPWLLRHLAWTARSALYEGFGGPAFDTGIGLSWGSVLKGQVRGSLAYAEATLLGRRILA